MVNDLEIFVVEHFLEDEIKHDLTAFYEVLVSTE